MTPRFVRSCLAVVFSALVFNGRAQPPAATPLQPIPPANADDPIVREVKLPDADIDTILSALELYTGRTVLRPAALQIGPGGFNLKLTTPNKTSEVIMAIETVLSLNNIGVAPLGDKFLIVTNIQLTRTNAPEFISGSAFDQPASGKIASKVFQLEFLRVAEIQGLINQVANPLLGGIFPLQNANAMLVTDSVSNLQRMELLLQQLDKPALGGTRPKFYTLTNGAKASDVVLKLRTIFGGTIQQQLGSATTFSADDRSNQIILITDPRQYPLFDELIAKLDVRADPNTRNEVIYLKHALAKDLIVVLKDIINGQNSAAQRSSSVRPGQGANLNQPFTPGALQGLNPQPLPGAPNTPVVNPAIVQAAEGIGAGSAEFSTVLTVAPDDRSNAIIVSGTTDDLRLLKALIDKLDLTLAQVRIEAVIAEVTLDDNNQSGIDSLGLQVDGDRLIGFKAAGPSFSIGGSAADSFTSISRIGGPGSLGRSLDLSAIINLGTTKRKDHTNILSTPTITTSHAKKGTIFVGETRPIESGTVNNGVNGGVTSTTSQTPIGINLEVTPLVGVDGSVQLDIKQDVDEVGGNLTINGNPTPIILKRNTNSFVSVQDGEIIVLGGLKRQINTKVTNRLGPIPIIGDFFGSKQHGTTRTELIFFIRPHVLTNTPADNVSTYEQVDQLEQRDAIRQQLDPKYKAPEPKKSVLDKILPHP